VPVRFNTVATDAAGLQRAVLETMAAAAEVDSAVEIGTVPPAIPAVEWEWGSFHRALRNGHRHFVEPRKVEATRRMDWSSLAMALRNGNRVLPARS